MSRQSPSPSVHSLRNGSNREQSLLPLNNCSPLVYSSAPQATVGETLGALVGASLTVVGNTIYTFAGFDQYTDEVYNSLHQLVYQDDAKENCQWKRVVYTKGKPPAKRNDHSASLWGHDKLVIYGGSSEEDERYHNDIAILDLSSMTWEHPVTFGNQPEGRIRHSATIYKDKLYIAGGITSNTTMRQAQHPDTLLILDLKTWIWQDPIPFVRRSQHITFVYHDRLYLFGGLHEDMTRSNYLSFIDLSDDASHGFVVTHLDNHSPFAPSLTAQRFLQKCDDQLVVIVTPSITPSSSYSTGDLSRSGIWTLDLESLQWRCRQMGIDSGRCHWHSSAMAEDGTHLYLFGADEELPDEYYSNVMCIDLKELGVIPVPQPQLGSDLARLLRLDMTKPDFVLHSSEDQEDIFVHRMILLVRWPYFYNLITELDCNHIDTLTFQYSSAALHGFVNYLYQDELGDDPLPIVCDILMMASEYKMDRLLALCTRRLYTAMDVNTVSKICHIARAAHQHGLHTKALQYLFEHFGAVSHSDGFRRLPRDELLHILDQMPENAAIVSHALVNGLSSSSSNGHGSVNGSTIMLQSQSNGSGVDLGLHRQVEMTVDNEEDGEDDEEEEEEDNDDAMET